VLPTRKVWSLREPIEGATKPPHAFVDGEDARFLGDGDLRGKRTVEILPAMSGG